MIRRRTRSVALLAVVSLLFVLIYCNSSYLSDPRGTGYFDDTFETYVLTKECGRSFDHISSLIPRGTILADNVAACESKQLEGWNVQEALIHFDELAYTAKYKLALDLCAQGKKKKCMILEDDVIFINFASNLFQRIKLHTWFAGSHSAFDCSKVGFGWFITGQTGNKSVCRIVDKRSAPCLASKMLTKPLAADLALWRAQELCHVSQHRFLLVQHTGYVSIIRN